MKTINILGTSAFLVMAVFQQSAIGRDLICKIDQISSTENGIEIHFSGNVTLNGTVINRTDGAKKFSVRTSSSASENGVVKSIFLKEDSVAYIANGFTDSCILRYANNEGRVGVKIEEMSHVKNKPPVLNSEFIEVN